MATNPEEVVPQAGVVRRAAASVKRTLNDYSLPLGALVAGLATEIIPAPFTGLVVVFIVLAVVEYER
jgi:hypothetical protein